MLKRIILRKESNRRSSLVSQGEIKWTYDATGRKLEKEVIAVNGVSVNYQDGIEIYSDGSTFATHAERYMAL